MKNVAAVVKVHYMYAQNNCLTTVKFVILSKIHVSI